MAAGQSNGWRWPPEASTHARQRWFVFVAKDSQFSSTRAIRQGQEFFLRWPPGRKGDIFTNRFIKKKGFLQDHSRVA